MADLDKAMFKESMGDNGMFTDFVGDLVVKAGQTLVIKSGEQLNISGSVTVKSGGRIEVAEGSIGFSIWGLGGHITVDKGGVIEFMPRKAPQGIWINNVTNNGNIIAGDNANIVDMGNFKGNRPNGGFYLQVDTNDLWEQWAIAAAPGNEGDKKAFVRYDDKGKPYSFSVAFYGLDNYWSVAEDSDGFNYTAELTPYYFYDAVWISDPLTGEDVTKFPATFDVPHGQLTFTAVEKGAFITVVAKYAFHAVEERNADIDALIAKQGAKPAAGAVTAPPLPTVAPTATPTPAPTATPAPVVTPAPTVDPNAPKIGTKLGDVLYSDIIAYINDFAVPSYNIDGTLYVLVADLRNYGFDARYDNDTRSVTIELAKGKAFTPLEVAANSGAVGKPAFAYLYTDIKTFINGKEVVSRNVSNQTAIPFAELRVFGEGGFDNATRSSRLVIK